MAAFKAIRANDENARVLTKNIFIKKININ